MKYVIAHIMTFHPFSHPRCGVSAFTLNSTQPITIIHYKCLINVHRVQLLQSHLQSDDEK